MSDDEIDAITARIVNLPPANQADVLLRMLEKVSDERDRLQAAWDRIALDPAEYRHALGHVANCDDNCEQCRDLARHALDGGVDAQERAADILAERKRLSVIVAAAREFVVAQREWIPKARDGGVTSTDDESVRRAAAVAGLALGIDQLDATPTGKTTDG